MSKDAGLFYYIQPVNSLRSIWNQMPVMRLLLAFIAGVALYIWLPVNSGYLVAIAGGLLLLSCAVIIFANSVNSPATIYRWRYASGAAVSIAMCTTGYILAFLNTDANDPHHITRVDTYFTGKKATYTGVIADPVVMRDKTVSVLLQIRKVTSNDTSVSTEGKILASIVRDSSSERLQYGDKLVLNGLVADYTGPQNPGQFDYGTYQVLHHIYRRVYLRDGDWSLTGSNQGNPILAKVYRLRAHFLSLIKESVHGTNELAVATAIMLGYRDYVNDEVIQAYSGSGVLHVLSVSGLHVAVLYYVLSLLLGWMDRRRRTEILKAVMVIIIMLFYAGLTGLSPPVLRSVWMFAFITIARLLDRDVSMYNILAVSCLLLLIWDPYYIADAGFQLSYIAVLGIVYLYPLIHRWIALPSFRFRTPFGFISRALNYSFDFVWGLICVSLAAQLATLPISLYYFHSFPHFFLLSNLLVIPLSNFVLISGMALFAVGWCHRLLVLVGWVFDYFLIVLNKVVFWIDALPYALSKGLMINLFEMILLYLLIMTTCWFAAERQAKVLLFSLLCTLVLFTSFSVNSIHCDRTKQLVVYHISGHKAMAFILHRQVYYDFDSALVKDEMLIRNNIRGHWWQCGVNSEQTMDRAVFAHRLSFGTLYAVCGRRILMLDQLVPDSLPRIKADIVILSGNNKNAIADLQKKIDFRLLVFDTSNRPAHLKRWIEDCERFSIKYHDCRTHAYELNL